VSIATCFDCLRQEQEEEEEAVAATASSLVGLGLGGGGKRRREERLLGREKWPVGVSSRVPLWGT